MRAEEEARSKKMLRIEKAKGEPRLEGWEEKRREEEVRQTSRREERRTSGRRSAKGLRDVMCQSAKLIVGDAITWRFIEPLCAQGIKERKNKPTKL